MPTDLPGRDDNDVSIAELIHGTAKWVLATLIVVSAIAFVVVFIIMVVRFLLYLI